MDFHGLSVCRRKMGCDKHNPTAMDGAAVCASGMRQTDDAPPTVAFLLLAIGEYVPSALGCFIP